MYTLTRLKPAKRQSDSIQMPNVKAQLVCRDQPICVVSLLIGEPFPSGTMDKE